MNFHVTSHHLACINGSRKKVFPTATLFIITKAIKARAIRAKTLQPKVIKDFSREAAVPMRALTISPCANAWPADFAKRKAWIAGQNKPPTMLNKTIKKTTQTVENAERLTSPLRKIQMVRIENAKQAAALKSAKPANLSALLCSDGAPETGAPSEVVLLLTFNYCLKYGIEDGSLPQAAARYFAPSFCTVPSANMV
jgi:hypothetical protein